MYAETQCDRIGDDIQNTFCEHDTPGEESGEMTGMGRMYQEASIERHIGGHDQGSMIVYDGRLHNLFSHKVSQLTFNGCE